MLDLGVKLRIVDFEAVYLFDFVAEETTVAGGVVQHLRIVAGAGKGCPVRQVLGVAGIRQADADELPGDEVLQQVQFVTRHTLELIEVDKHIFRHAGEVVLVSGGDDAGAEVIGPQLVRQNVVDESCFSQVLLAA